MSKAKRIIIKTLATLIILPLTLLEGICSVLEDFFGKTSNRLYRATDRVIYWVHKDKGKIK